jgi:hypothetical protein
MLTFVYQDVDLRLFEATNGERPIVKSSDIHWLRAVQQDRLDRIEQDRSGQ